MTFFVLLNVKEIFLTVLSVQDKSKINNTGPSFVFHRRKK